MKKSTKNLNKEGNKPMLKKFNVLFDIISDQRKQIAALEEELAKQKEIRKRNERLLEFYCNEKKKGEKK